MATYQACSPIVRSAQGPPRLASFFFFGPGTKHNCFCFCFGWPFEPPPPGVGQLCRTLGKSRPAASLGRPGGPEWAQFVLIPYSLAGTALRPSWKGVTKREPAILGSVGGPCRERVWPSTRPARRLKDRPRGLPDLLRSGSKLCIFIFPILTFPERSGKGGLWNSSGNHYWPAPPWKRAVASLPKGQGPARVFPPMVSEVVVATPNLTRGHGVSLPPP